MQALIQRGLGSCFAAFASNFEEQPSGRCWHADSACRFTQRGWISAAALVQSVACVCTMYVRSSNRVRACSAGFAAGPQVCGKVYYVHNMCQQQMYGAWLGIGSIRRHLLPMVCWYSLAGQKCLALLLCVLCAAVRSRLVSRHVPGIRQPP